MDEVFQTCLDDLVEAWDNIGYHVGTKSIHCPECGKLPKWNKTYTTAAGTIQHYMKCRDKECNTYFKVNNKTYQDYFKFNILNDIK